MHSETSGAGSNREAGPGSIEGQRTGGAGGSDAVASEMYMLSEPANQRRRWLWALRGPGIAAVLLLLLVACIYAVYRPPASSDWWLWVLSLVVVGMPHGAYDLAVFLRTSRSKSHAALRFGGYTLVMVACIAALMLFPVPTAVAFLLLAAHHFGLGDSVWTRNRPLRAEPSPARRVLRHAAATGRGVAVIFAPFVFSPLAAWSPFGTIAGLVAGTGPLGLGSLTAPMIAAGAGGLVILGLLAQLAWACSMLVMRSRGGAVASAASQAHSAVPARLLGAGLLEEWGTIAAVLVLSAVAPPLVAIGAYFVLVHASGHCARALVPARRAPAPGLGNAWRVHVESLPLLVVSVLMVLGLAWWFGLAGGVLAAESLGLSFLGFCIVATLPHHLLWLPRG